MTPDNEALKLANSAPELQSLLYDVDLMPEQLDTTGIGYKRMLAIVEAYKIGIQTGRDQLQKELAEQKPFGVWHQGDTEDESDFHYGDAVNAKDCEYCIALIPQPTMPEDR